MINKICVIIPTRERLNKFRIFASTWKKTTEGKSVVVVGIDNDDHTYDELRKNKYPEFIWEQKESKPCLSILNDLAVKYAKKYKYILFMEDDTNFNTLWESRIIEKLEELGDNGIVWCNDLRVKEKLISLPIMNSSIINRLGYMLPPEFKAQCPDLYWTDLGNNLKTMYYFPDIITEHRHYSTGKTFKDETAIKIQKEAINDATYYHSPAYLVRLSNDVKMLLNDQNYKVKKYSS